MTLFEYAQSIYHRVARWWRPPTPEPPTPPRMVREPAASKAQFDPDSGEFFFREVILDQLDYYFTCIKRLRRRDPDAFALHARLGALVMPRPLMDDSNTPMIVNRASPWFAQTLPDFGAVFYGDVAQRHEAAVKGKTVWPRFFYFRKYKPGHVPCEIEATHDGTVYVISCYWDLGAVDGQSEFAVVVDKAGRLRLLRQRSTERVTIRHKRGCQHQRQTTVERQVWAKGGGTFLNTWAAEHSLTSEHLAEIVFAKTTTLFELANASMIRISINRGDLTAAFSVNIKRTPYFFKDRDLRVNENGHRKRIFHIVRPHVRASGSTVRMHFRGERSFDWNGYRVVITVPGRHHHDMTEFNVGLVDVETVDDGIGLDAFGAGVRRHIQHGRDLGHEMLNARQP